MRGSAGAASNHPAQDQATRRANHGFGHWRLSSRLEFGPLPSAVPCARLHTKHILREWNLAHVADEAELIVSELMTNALHAARPLPGIQPITLHLLASHEYLVIGVWDAVAAAPAPRPHALDAESGRGLELVAMLSDRQGYYHPIGGGKVVWAALITGAPPSAAKRASEHRAEAGDAGEAASRASSQ
jgi:anti-sigma regulatory factor (Ser/Thr protein kinase)